MVMFRGKLEFLSNFDQTEFYFPPLDRKVKSGEHAFNALKSADAREIEHVLSAKDPREAKGRGRRVNLVPSWDEYVRDAAMSSVLQAKFTVPSLRAQLLGTESMELVETNTWHDQYWGDCLCPRHKDLPGANRLGTMLMGLRSVLNSCSSVTGDRGAGGTLF